MELLKEEQKIAIILNKNDSIIEMLCKIEKVFDDRLNIILPQYFMRYIAQLQVGCKITVKVFTKFGTIDFNSIIINSPLEDSFTIELDYNSIKLMSNSDSQSINAVETLKMDVDKDKLTLKTFEISPNFIKFTSDKGIPIGKTFKSSIILPQDYGIIECRLTIKEVDPIYDNEYTAVFASISENSMQSMLYYMYMYNNDTD